jgi:hypothetical protein
VNVTAEREEAQRFPYLVAHKTLKRIELHERQRVRVTGHERAKSLKPSKGTARERGQALVEDVRERGKTAVESLRKGKKNEGEAPAA